MRVRRLRRPGERGRQRPRHSRRRHHRGHAQRLRPQRCRPERQPGQHPGGQDSGYFFLPVVDALTYAGDTGLDVVNMSFYVDPWLYNCVAARRRTRPEQAADQDVIIEAMTRALDYAHDSGVTLVAAPRQQPRGPAEPAHGHHQPGLPGGPTPPATIDNATCFDLPAEGPHVLGTSSLGPSGKKADYSNYTDRPDLG